MELKGEMVFETIDEGLDHVGHFIRKLKIQYWKRSVFIPIPKKGNAVGCRLWGRTGLDTTEAT